MVNLKMHKNKKSLMMLVSVLVIIALAIGGGYYYNKYHDSQKKVAELSNPQAAAKAQVDAVVAKVGQLAELPSGETPTLATVTDPSKLSGQAFFANSKAGDQVLIYTQAKKAFLYRPSTNKIIEIAPVNIGSSSTTSGQ